MTTLKNLLAASLLTSFAAVSFAQAPAPAKPAAPAATPAVTTAAAPATKASGAKHHKKAHAKKTDGAAPAASAAK